MDETRLESCRKKKEVSDVQIVCRGEESNWRTQTILYPEINIIRFATENVFIGALTNLLKTKRRLLYLKTQFVARSKHFSSRL